MVCLRNLRRSVVGERQIDKATRFRALHDGEPFVIPNPWDAGTAMVLESLGFPALATTSSGFAFTLGRLDGAVTLDQVAGHVTALDAATSLPVSADLENGYGAEPVHAAAAITQIAAAGAVAASIEDWDADRGLYPVGLAVERIEAAREAALASGLDFMLTARAENHIRGNPDLDDTVARLQAYERAGADVLYAPGLRELADIRHVCSAVGRPVNVLALTGMDVRDVFAAGAQRVSVGGGLTWSAIGAMAAAASALRDSGDASLLGSGGPIAEYLRR